MRTQLLKPKQRGSKKESEVKPMNTILDTDKLNEMAAYIEQLPDAPDNTNGKELTGYAAQLCREINEQR